MHKVFGLLVMLLVAQAAVAQNWENTYVEERASLVRDMVGMPDDGVLVAAAAGDLCEVPLMVKYDALGNEEWSTGVEGADRILPLDNGNYMVVGTNFWNQDFNWGQIFLYEITAAGQVLSEDTVFRYENFPDQSVSIFPVAIDQNALGWTYIASDNRLWVVDTPGVQETPIDLFLQGAIAYMVSIDTHQLAVATDMNLYIVDDQGAILHTANYSETITGLHWDGQSIQLGLTNRVEELDETLTLMNSTLWGSVFPSVQRIRWSDNAYWIMSEDGSGNNIQLAEIDLSNNLVELNLLSKTRGREELSTVFAISPNYFFLYHRQLHQMVLAGYEIGNFPVATTDYGLTLGPTTVSNVQLTSFANGIGTWTYDAEIAVFNNGQEMVSDFNIFYLTEGSNCGGNYQYDAFTNMNLAPTSFVTVTMSGLTHFGPTGFDLRFCAEVLAPNGTVELNTEDNDTCQTFTGFTSVAEHQRALPFKVFPNPTSSQLHVQWDQPTTAVWTVLDVQGKRVGAYTTHTGSAQLEVAHLPAGMYFLSVSTGNETYRTRFVKE